MGMQPILPITVPIKKIIKGATHQHYGDGDGIAWCEWAFVPRLYAALPLYAAI